MSAQIEHLPWPANLFQNPDGKRVLVPAGCERVIGDIVREGDYIAEKPFEHELHDIYPASVWNLATPLQVGRSCAEFVGVARPLQK